MKNNDQAIANPFVMLREEFDDWAVLFNPDTGRGFGLSPTGVFLWKLLNGEHTVCDLVTKILHIADCAPEEARDHIGAFIDALVKEGLAAFENAWPGHLKNADKAQSYPEESSCALRGEESTLKPFMYDPPKLINLSSNQVAHGACGGGSSADCCGSNGHLATTCSYGNGGGYLSNCTPCNYGDCVYWDDSNCACTGSCYNNCCGGNCKGQPNPRDCYDGTCARGCGFGSDPGIW